jgi:hypothetical protein
MDEWEYLTTYIKALAKTKDTRQFLKQLRPKWRPPAFTPEALMPELNKLGKEGWELMHIEPVAAVGKKGDILFDGESRKWSNVYFCVFKRRVRANAAAPVDSQPQTDQA